MLHSGMPSERNACSHLADDYGCYGAAPVSSEVIWPTIVTVVCHGHYSFHIRLCTYAR